MATGDSNQTLAHRIFDDEADIDNKATERGRGRGSYRPNRRPRGRALSSDISGIAENRAQSKDRSDLITEGGRYGHRGQRRGRGTFRGQRHQSILNESGVFYQKNQSCDDQQEQQQSMPKAPREQREMRFGKLKDLIKDGNPNEVFLELSQSRSGFIELIEKSFDFKDNALYILKALVLATKSDIESNLREFLDRLHPVLIPKILHLLSKLQMKDRSAHCICSNLTQMGLFLSDISEFLQALMSTIPSTLPGCNTIIIVLKQFPSLFSGLKFDTESLEAVFGLVKTEHERRTDTDLAKKKPVYKTGEHDMTPPNNFREISIFPTLDDIHINELPFLRANKTKGRYDSLDTYLDTQFRLLREDYVQPLRQGIHEYRSCIKDGLSVNRLRNVRIYQNVQIMQPVCSGKGINHVLQFDTSHLKIVNWESSRRLLFGSLVCLSVDNFDTIHYATITERDANELKDGTIEVHFENVGDGVLDLSGNASFVMAETTAYFEAYRYILEGLTELKDTMPMMRYIIECETVIKPPSYLLGHGGPEYDFQTLLKDKIKGILYPVLNTQRWPTCSDLGLDCSQYHALQTAITKEFAIIQGPPGTGKTFVGIKVAELLLKNSTFWKTGEEKSPILVVCYTNHALDQFLEGISNVCNREGIIRIGGRCKNEKLVPFMLRNVKAKRRELQAQSFKLMQNEKDCRARLRDSERKIEEISAKIKRTTSHIVSLKTLEPYMNENHAKEFDLMIQMNQTDEKNCFQTWLAFQPFANHKSINVDAQTHIKQTWTQFILHEVQPIPIAELNEIDNIFNKDLYRKAEIYKTLHVECTGNVKGPLAKLMNTRLLSFEELKRGILDPVTKIKLNALTAKIEAPKHSIVDKWLCTNEVNKIKEALDHFHGHSKRSGDIDGKSETDDDELKEERVLDDMDDDFMFDYKRDHQSIADKNWKKLEKKLSDEEWITVFGHKKNAQRVKTMLNKARPMTEETVCRLKSIRALDKDKRLDLYAYWLQKRRTALKQAVKVHEDQFRISTESLQEVRDLETVHILKESVVMGMTTTGAAKYRKVLQRVKPQIIIVEEAAEVLESHIITTLNTNCKHLILIGDHKQLRPSTTVYELAKKYEMDISLFERMVRNDVPCVTLEEQHRMRPEISRLLRRERLYPKLRDHESVFRYDQVRGVDFNMQFISHEEEESCSGDSTSYSNPHEAKYLAALCKYFLNQGYTKDQITVLTPYMGQVMLLRNEMPKSIFEGVRITAIDNFQGEENDIILLSLVRSSMEGHSRKRNPIGFVGIENRICVALSRAKQGMFVIGNFKLLERSSQLWEEIIAELKESDSIKTHLLLRCGNHPKMCTAASSAQDFTCVPDGGCNKPCGMQLPCGHICPRACHVCDITHTFVTCYKPCEKINSNCTMGHKCTKKCFQECGSCFVKIEKVIPMCRHVANLPCHMDPFEWRCQEVCQFILPCEHSCDQKCFKCQSEAHNQKCGKLVTRELLCGHEMVMQCHLKTHNQKCEQLVTRKLLCGHEIVMQCYMDVASVICVVNCNAIHECGHPCSGKCGTCFDGKIHKKCKGTCGKTLPCGHKCTFPCSEEQCPPCSQKCKRTCSHNIKCKKKCSEPCNSCENKCCYQCKHGKCENICRDECSVMPCNEKCGKELECTHICRGLCGEKCLCIICNKHLIRNESENEFTEETVFLQLPDCKCVFEVGHLDRSIETQANSERKDFALHCPFTLCRKLLETDVRRYSTRLKRVKQDIIKANTQLQASDVRLIARNVVSQLNNIKHVGFITEQQYTQLNRQIVKGNKSALSILGKRLDKLQYLYKVVQLIGTAKSSGLIESIHVDGVLNEDYIKQAILAEKLNTTKQFWTEISREINRLQICLKFCLLKKHLNSKGNSAVDQALDLSFRAIRSPGFDSDLFTELMSVSSTLHASISALNISDLDINVASFKLKSKLELCELQVSLKMKQIGSSTEEKRTVAIFNRKVSSPEDNRAVTIYNRQQCVEGSVDAGSVSDQGHAAKAVEHPFQNEHELASNAYSNMGDENVIDEEGTLIL
ncbi:NFX1-type zinc finger-containing protein 1-like [Dreissena polymorpha]|uniref:NF-X1-type domain-containing protein n=1 Tax=Dreissena polymorpha TaxID=45954 RepID=A0A9D4BVP2_DREPO|nr:NFX1-type zinc finger-containing protein 1-like [Dreissena polymorpha]XP_052251695.1 NFX1-type zinc finger-containing protein 1-like [Dreissena polymorpha]KAH3711004.1 hypothetical protein DPMN_070503 [Dreissena polymorpha]